MQMRLTAAMSTLGLVALLGGCASDEHSFSSPVDQASTLYVIDASSQAPLWEKQIPEGQRLVINLDRMAATDFTAQAIPADRLSWKLYPGTLAAVSVLPVKKPYERGTVNLPGTPVRLELFLENNEQPNRGSRPVPGTPRAAEPAAPAGAATRTAPPAPEAPAASPSAPEQRAEPEPTDLEGLLDEAAAEPEIQFGPEAEAQPEGEPQDPPADEVEEAVDVEEPAAAEDTMFK